MNSHTTTSPSLSRMYGYAGCECGTVAILCRIASAQVILPFRLSLRFPLRGKAVGRKAREPGLQERRHPRPRSVGTKRRR